MSFSSYFSDNQTKQKAYDKYYNQMARSDFVQRRKLKALIAQEAADESLTDKLAQLYMGSVGKAPDYDYDRVLKKIQKSKPEVVKGPTVEIPTAPSSETPATQPRRGRPRRSSVDMILQDQGTNQFIKQTRRELFDRSSKKTNMAGDAEEKAFNDAEEYVYEYQKKQRAKKATNRRELNDAELVEAKKRIAEKILQQNDAAADARPAEKAKQAKRRLRMGDDETETKISPEELERRQNLARMKELVKFNKAIRQKYEGVIKSFVQQKNYSQTQLYDALQRTVGSDIDDRTHDGYFEANGTKGPLKPSARAHGEDSFKKYLAKVRAQVNAVLY
ncbi:unnamed protein product [Phytophthora lilii]|uniref:Unnamed protein product n=1 Tax=Phytophthora lilii TaxID=2077276 RepID=A0A9W7CRW3_9STRA|nr:unnamed protein product [Phytophthora lilii]